MDMISVAFDDTVKDWQAFADELNELPADTRIAFDVGEPLMHHFFCKFIHKIERKWTLRTTLIGPGYQCLRVNAGALLVNCQEIVAVFPEGRVGFYEWLRKVAFLGRVMYNIRVETTVPFDEVFVRNVTHGLTEFPIKLVGTDGEADAKDC